MTMKKIALSLIVTACATVAGTASAANFYNCSTSGSSASCVAVSGPNVSSTYSKTKYPLVFANGMLGFNSIGPINYFYGVPQDLTENGAQVYVTKETALNSSESRGEELLKQVRTVIALTNSGKVNLLGHSHGGHSIRYVSAIAPSLVASATSISSPHKGSPVADIVKGVTSGPLQPIIGQVANGFAQIINGLSGGSANKQDAIATMNALTTAGSAAFTRSFPQAIPTSACGEGAYTVNGIRYYSWGGTRVLTNVLDPIDAGFALTTLGFLGSQNDGVVGQCSNHMGQVIRDNFGMNHLDSINQSVGLVNLFETNPKTVYRDHANRLKNVGL